MKQEDDKETEDASISEVVETQSEIDMMKSQNGATTQWRLAQKTKEQNCFIKKFNRKHAQFKETLKVRIKGKKSKLFGTQNLNLAA